MSINSTNFVRPTYFEIFTKILNEMSWREVSDFDAIEKTEHKRVLNLINATNSDVLCSYVWDFQIEKKDITVQKNTTVIEENFNGRIISINEGSKKYIFVHPSRISDVTNSRSNIYSINGNSIITNPSMHERKLTLTYVSNCCAINSKGEKITQMSAKNDTSILPMPYLEPILVYGTLIKVKANPSFAKFGYWRTLYLNAVTSLRSNGAKTIEDTPRINIY